MKISGVIILITSLYACSEASLTEQSKTVRPPSKIDNSAQSASPESTTSKTITSTSGKESTTVVEDSVAKPVTVTGAYLRCTETAVKGTDIELGCRVDDQDGKKIGPEQLADEITYSYVKPSGNDLTVTLTTVTAAHRIFDILLNYSSPSLSQSRKASLDTKVSISMKNPIVPAISSIESALVSTIIKPTDEGAFSIRTEGNQTFVFDRISGIEFTRVKLGSLNWSDSNNACRGLSASTLWELVYYDWAADLFAHGVLDKQEAITALGLVPNLNVWMQEKDTTTAWSLKVWINGANHGEYDILGKNTLLSSPLCAK